MDAITPAFFLRYGTFHSEGRSETEGSVGFDSFPRSMSPQRWDFSQLVRAKDRESAHQDGSFGRWTRGSQLHPACCAVGSLHTTPGFPVSMQDEVGLLAARRPGHTSSMKTPEHSFWPKDHTQ